MKRELAVVAEFARVAKELKEVPKDERTKVLQAKLRLLELPSSFLLPYNPKYALVLRIALRFVCVCPLCADCETANACVCRFEVSKLLVEKCRVMDSMTVQPRTRHTTR